MNRNRNRKLQKSDFPAIPDTMTVEELDALNEFVLSEVAKIESVNKITKDARTMLHNARKLVKLKQFADEVYRKGNKQIEKDGEITHANNITK